MRSVLVYGAGKVGGALARGLARAGVTVTLRHARRSFPRALAAPPDLVLLCVRDEAIGRAAAALAESGLLARRERIAVLHCAGAVGLEPLACLRERGIAVGRFHPLVSFADRRRPPALAGAAVHLSGDRAAVRAGRAAARRLGMRPLDQPLDLATYHAAAALVANGAVTLVACGADLLVAAGLARVQAPALLGPLLRSVADNVSALGLPAALTGPVRRGDAIAIGRHLAAIAAVRPDVGPLYAALAQAQLPLARALAEAPAESFRRIERLLDPRKRRKK